MAQLPGGTILLPCMGSNRGVFLFRSEDNGESWEGPDRVGEGLDGVEDWQGLYPYGKIRLLTDGTVIMPVSGRLRDTGEHLTAHMRSSDDGWTWDEFVVLSTGIVNYNETIELPNGRLMAMVEIDDEASTQNLNDSPPDGMSPFFWTWSEDQGRTWSELEEAVEPIYGQSPSLFLTQRGTLICGHRWLGDLDQGYVGVAFSVYKPEKGRDGVWNGTPTIVWLGRILNSNYPGRPIHRDYSWAGYPSITYVDDERILCAYFMSWRGGGDSTAQDIEGVYYVEED